MRSNQFLTPDSFAVRQSFVINFDMESVCGLFWIHLFYLRLDRIM